MTAPKDIHEKEQMVAGFRHMASVLWTHYSALKEEGFDHASALELTCLYQVSLCEPCEDEE